MLRLTIGMAVYDSFADAQHTIQSLRLFHILPDDLDAEILVIDNHPGSHSQSIMLKNFCEGWGDGLGGERLVRYVAMAEPTGTSQPRNRVFAEAKGEIVLCMDAHVHVAPGALKRLLDWFDAHRESMDLVTGPILWDNLEVGATHWEPVWGDDAMLGQWAQDRRGTNPDNERFEIPGMGLGLFACRKKAWLGFHPDARGFGGEEMCYHEKVRQAGRKTLCLPFLRWWHKFTDPRYERPAYTPTLEDKAANYVLWFRSLAWDLAPVREAFVRPGKLTEAGWRHIVADPVWNRSGVSGGGVSGGSFNPEPTAKARSVVRHGAAKAAAHGTHWPGLSDAADRWCRENREWSAILHRPVEPGITLLRRDPNYTPPPGFGPGTELKGLLASIGIVADPTCDCIARMEQMDRWGVEGCAKNRETIVAWLKEGQDRWGWRDEVSAAAKAVASGLALRLSLADPLGALVDESIRLAERS